MIAALFVQKNGVYYGLPDVDPWDNTRDAMRYDGPWPVVAHPPCARWCMLAGLVEARWGHRKGDDGGAFAHALSCVRRWGGVLEHPAWSAAFRAHDLPRPTPSAGWSACLGDPGWVAHVEQRRYGHPAKKATWLYAVKTALPSLLWGSVPGAKSTALVSWCGNRVSSGETRPRLSKARASRTPINFRDILLDMARSVPQ